jgi:hypothetical protein
MLWLLIPLASVGVVALAVWFVVTYSRETNARWADAAQQLGLEFRPSGPFSRPTITGQSAGHTIRIDTVTHSSGKSQHTDTRFRVEYPSQGFDFALSREHALRRLSKMFGAQDIEIGDPSFDEAFIVKTSDPEKLAAVLTPAVRDSLIRLLAVYPQVQVRDGHIGYERSGLTRDTDALVSTTRRLLATARVIAGTTGRAEADELIGARHRGELRAVAEQFGRLASADPYDIDNRLRELDTLASAGDEAAAAERLADLETLLPADPEVAGWRKTLGKPIPEPSLSPGVVNADPEPIAVDLFGGDDLSFETLAKFNATYRGSSIRWEGRVKSAAPFRNDPDLGTGPGVRASITVARVSNDLYGNTDVDVVAGLPDDAGRRPVAAGDAVIIEGKLSGIDPLARNLFVQDARLVE